MIKVTRYWLKLLFYTPHICLKNSFQYFFGICYFFLQMQFRLFNNRFYLFLSYWKLGFNFTHSCILLALYSLICTHMLLEWLCYSYTNIFQLIVLTFSKLSHFLNFLINIPWKKMRVVWCLLRELSKLSLLLILNRLNLILKYLNIISKGRNQRLN